MRKKVNQLVKQRTLNWRKKEAKKRAEEAMQNRGTDFDLALAQSEFAMAAAQLAAIARFRRKK